MDWQPIETAPEGEYVQLKFGEDEADDYGPFIGMKMDHGGWWDRTGSDYDYGAAQPTHWRPEQRV
jgi:hypothetical protein